MLWWWLHIPVQSCDDHPRRDLGWRPRPCRSLCVLTLARPRPSLGLTGLGSRGGLEVLVWEVPKTPQTGRRCQRGELILAAAPRGLTPAEHRGGARGGRVPSSCVGRAGGEQAGGSLFLERKDHYFLILKRFRTGKGVFQFVNPRLKGCKEGVLLLWLSAAMGFARPRVCCSDLHTIPKTSLGEPAPGECP